MSKREQTKFRILMQSPQNAIRSGRKPMVRVPPEQDDTDSQRAKAGGLF
jgi:hypothetical protein